MRDFLRFVLSSSDQGRIAPESIAVEDVDFSQRSFPRIPQPQSLRLSFRITDPENGAPQIYPLFPGGIRFRPEHPDTRDPVLPSPGDVAFTSGSSSSWTTKGTLGIYLANKNLHQDIVAHTQGLELAPNRVWYHPIQLTERFLFQTLAGHGGPSMPFYNIFPYEVPSGDQDAHAVAFFLQGLYAPISRLHPTDTSQDDYVALPMPTVDMKDDGSVEVHVTMAFYGTPHEGSDVDFLGLEAARNPGGDGSSFWPHYPQNGVLPARLVFQKIGPDTTVTPPSKGHLVDALPTDALLSRVLDQNSAGQHYKLVRFTRTWRTHRNNGNPINDFSPHLARQRVQLRVKRSGDLIWDDFLPAHGLVYIPFSDSSSATLDIHTSLVDGDMRWAWGAGDNWQTTGHRDPIEFDAAQDPTHFVLRRPMRDVMLVERPNRPPLEDARCTYISLRRTIRALIDNRIAGGRFLRNGRTPPLVRDLVRAAWPRGRPGADPDQVFNGRPKPEIESISKGNRILRKILIRFFGADHGWVVSALWQSWVPQFQDPSESARYDDHYIGRGAAGAFAFLDLVVGHVPDQYSIVAVNDAQKMLSGLEPGALIQFWEKNTDYFNTTQRQAELEPVPDRPDRMRAKLEGAGHSPVFYAYLLDSDNVIVGMRVYDQGGITNCPFDSQRNVIRWHGYEPEVWIAANWRE